MQFTSISTFVSLLFCQTSLFLQVFVIKPFQYRRGDRFISLTCWGFFCHIKLQNSYPESKLSLYAHFAFFVLLSFTKCLRNIILIVKKIRTAEVISPTSTHYWLLNRDCFFITHRVSICLRLSLIM